jgi:hypothetical protein
MVYTKEFAGQLFTEEAGRGAVPQADLWNEVFPAEKRNEMTTAAMGATAAILANEYAASHQGQKPKVGVATLVTRTANAFVPPLGDLRDAFLVGAGVFEDLDDHFGPYLDGDESYGDRGSSDREDEQ